MHILITAGGTSEPIDQVRSITNHSTGRLGQQIAQAFLKQQHQVTYLTTPQALKPSQHPLLQVLEIQSTSQLDNTLQTLFQQTAFDCVIHSMAVSDFTTEISLTQDQLANELTSILSQQSTITSTTIKESLDIISKKIQTEQEHEKKISSDTARLLLFLKKNPKIIAKIRQQQPQTILIGFKLLVDVSREELLNVALKTLQQNQCDFILANDLSSIHGDSHHGLLLDENKNVIDGYTKEEISQLIVKTVEERKSEKK